MLHIWAWQRGEECRAAVRTAVLADGGGGQPDGYAGEADVVGAGEADGAFGGAGGAERALAVDGEADHAGAVGG